MGHWTGTCWLASASHDWGSLGELHPQLRHSAKENAKPRVPVRDLLTHNWLQESEFSCSQVSSFPAAPLLTFFFLNLGVTKTHPLSIIWRPHTLGERNPKPVCCLTVFKRRLPQGSGVRPGTQTCLSASWPTSLLPPG